MAIPAVVLFWKRGRDSPRVNQHCVGIGSECWLSLAATAYGALELASRRCRRADRNQPRRVTLGLSRAHAFRR